MPKKKITSQERQRIAKRQLLHDGRNPKKKITFKERMLQILLGIPPAEEDKETEMPEQTHEQDHETEEELRARLEEEAEYVKGTKGPGRSPGHPE